LKSSEPRRGFVWGSGALQIPRLRSGWQRGVWLLSLAMARWRGVEERVPNVAEEPGGAGKILAGPPGAGFGGRKGPSSMDKKSTFGVLRLRATKRCVTR
jgi:hypothetical protein